MPFDTPFQLYSHPNYIESLQHLQKIWQNKEYWVSLQAHFIAIADGRLQGMETLLTWLSKPTVYDTSAITTLMNLRNENKENIFREGFLNMLQRFYFEGELWAVPAQTDLFEGQPIIYLHGTQLQTHILKLWVSYLIQPATAFLEVEHLWQVRRFSNQQNQRIQDIIYTPDSEPIVNFEAASWHDLLQPIFGKKKTA